MTITQEDAISWKTKWIKQQSLNSLHSDKFWDEISNLILEGRLKMKNNPLVPIGVYAFEWAGAMEFLVARNNQGIEFEKNGNIESAIIIYEASVADYFFGTHPYDRLRIYYSKQKWYQDSIRVCQVYLNLPDRKNGQNKPRFQNHLEKLLTKVKSQ